jgi:hypothetical protein
MGAKAGRGRAGFVGSARRAGRPGWAPWAAAVVLAAASLLPRAARGQDRAVVVVSRDGFAPPPGDDRGASDQAAARPQVEDAPARSAVRLGVGPEASTTGRGLGAGLGVAADFGRGTLGFRLAGAWLHGEPSSGSPSPVGGGLAQYTGELTVDFARRGPWRPVLGLGLGYARVDTGRAAGDVGIGTARLALEYALGFDDADVRVGAGVSGALPGPADGAVTDVKGWALVGASLVVGF